MSIAESKVVKYDMGPNDSVFETLMRHMPEEGRKVIMECATLSLSAFLSDPLHQLKIVKQLGPDRSAWPKEVPNEVLQGSRTKEQVVAHLAQLLEAIIGAHDGPQAAKEYGSSLAEVLLGALFNDGLLHEHVNGTLSVTPCREACCQKAANELPC